MTLTKEQMIALRHRCHHIVGQLRERYEKNNPDGIIGAMKSSYDANDYMWARMCMELFQEIHYLEHRNSPPTESNNTIAILRHWLNKRASRLYKWNQEAATPHRDGKLDAYEEIADFLTHLEEDGDDESPALD